MTNQQETRVVRLTLRKEHWRIIDLLASTACMRRAKIAGNLLTAALDRLTDAGERLRESSEREPYPKMGRGR